MSGYIEKPRKGEFFNPISSTTPIINNNTDGSSNNSTPSNTDENYDRWRWLIDGWEKMTFKERMALFMPYFHYVNPRDYYKREFDKTFQNEMIEVAYKLCRTFMQLKFDPDGQGIPNLIMIFNPIDPDMIPNLEVRTLIKSWGKKYGFYKDSSDYCQCIIEKTGIQPPCLCE